jgi:hypothetical protein
MQALHEKNRGAMTWWNFHGTTQIYPDIETSCLATSMLLSLACLPTLSP